MGEQDADSVLQEEGRGLFLICERSGWDKYEMDRLCNVRT